MSREQILLYSPFTHKNDNLELLIHGITHIIKNMIKFIRSTFVSTTNCHTQI
jgi:hypothetical protein